MTIQLTNEPEEKVVLGPYDSKVTIKKRPNPGLSRAFEFTEERMREGRPPHTITLRDLPPVPEEEKGRLYTEEEVGWIFDTEPVFVRLSWKQKVLLRKIVTLVSFADLPEGTEAQDIADLLEEIDFPHRFGR